MKLEFISKSLDYLNNDPYRTKVVLGNSDGAFYPIYFDKDAISKSDAELFTLASEKIYQDNFPNRAETEKFNVIDKMIEEATQKLGKMDEQAQLSVSSRSAFLKVVMTLYGKGLLTDEDLLQTGLFDDEVVE
ncbi:DUF1366 domain-containing protein [Streptococcus parasuis]|uniref:DUF1366 domain-containing protein n=1 Tax=Streptococcus parasuis TaxID=1501662 RepID=UPI0025A52A68|nr:DUF1366 domain-containing protein [Streptococcus parasuis]WJQ86087.1 DUF1366 domain-containing protein [Streptococcus parasuis]